MAQGDPWYDLSDSEIANRLIHRGIDETTAWYVCHHRDHYYAEINDILRGNGARLDL